MNALEFYQLREQPFGVTPDARYLFLTPAQKEALNSVIYGIESGCGFVALIAKPGLGKTTLLFQTLDILREKARLVFLFQTISTPSDLLRALLSGLGVQDIRGSLIEMQIRLKNLLTEHSSVGKRVVLVIDEAQNLDDSVLEMVRMLSNFETASDKLLQIVLAGQPQLAENIGSPELLQLRQRVSIFARLKPFTPEETTLYIAHRLRVAGYASDMPLFTKDALALIAQGSEGIPRNINNFCFNALSAGFALEQRPIDRDIVRQVMTDLDVGQLRKKFAHPVHSEETVTVLKAAPVYSAQKPQAVSAKWLPKAAVAAVALLAVSTALFAGRAWLSRPAAPTPAAVAYIPPAPIEQPLSMVSEPPVSATVDTPPPVPSPQQESPVLAPSPVAVQKHKPASPDVSQTAPLLSAETPLPPVDSAGIVRVSPGQTLRGICVQQFGSCNAELIRQIHELNPRLNDLDHIESGQKLRLPVLAAQSNILEQPQKASSADKGTHE